MAKKRWRGFLITPEAVEELAENGDVVCRYDEPTLFDDLVLAGYPLTPGRRHCLIDLSVDPDALIDVVVYTQGVAPQERSMGPASGLFMAWHKRQMQPRPEAEERP